MRQRPPHPAPYVRDDRDTPLMWDGMAGDIKVIWVLREWKCFCSEGWTDRNSLNAQENFLSIVIARFSVSHGRA
jgi:hypothetical protein